MIRSTLATLGLPFDTFWDKARALALAVLFLAVAVMTRLFAIGWIGYAILGDAAAGRLLSAVSPALSIAGLGFLALLALSASPARD